MDKHIASEVQISEYLLLNPLFITLLSEVKELSKKKPGDVVNEYKGKTINKVLKRLLEILKDEPTIDFLELIDLDTLPTNSDVVFIMVQFETSLSKLQTRDLLILCLSIALFYRNFKCNFQDLFFTVSERINLT